MSSNIKKRKYQEPEEPIEGNFDVKTVIFPFSLLPGKRELYIYTGEEKIPFRERHPVYQELFLSEFKIYLNKI